MPEARDRLTRSNNRVSETFNRRRTTIDSIGIYPDNEETERSINLTPFRWGSTPLTGGGESQRVGVTLTTRRSTRGRVSGRGLFETPMRVYRRGSRNQNTPPGSSGSGGPRRGRGVPHTGTRGVLPAWYPRTPLGDITHVVRAIERRRERMGDGAGHVLGSVIPIWMDHQPADLDNSPSNAQLEHDVSFVTPKAKFGTKMYKQSALGRVPLILNAVANKCEGELEFETPQKKLLNSIEVVEKVVMEELHRLMRTPSAKRAEREKRVRTLMSMR